MLWIELQFIKDGGDEILSLNECIIAFPVATKEKFSHTDKDIINFLLNKLK